MGFLDNVKKNLGVAGREQHQDGGTSGVETAADSSTARPQDTGAAASQDAAPAQPGAAPAQPGQARQVIVEPGDTLAGIAEQFGVDADALLLANADTVPNPDLIYPGQVLRLP